MIPSESEGSGNTSTHRRMYRDFRADMSRLDGTPISDVEGDLAMVADVLRKEGYLTSRIVDGRICYRRTRKTNQTLEVMDLGSGATGTRHRHPGNRGAP